MTAPLRDRIAPAFRPEPGDVVGLGARRMLVVESGRLDHTGGYGPVELRGVDLFERPFAVGTMVGTPWGMIEIVAVDDARFAPVVARARETRNFRTAEPPRLPDLDEDPEDDAD